MQARASLFAVALAAGTFAVAAPAQANWSDNFDDGDTAGWMFFNHTGGAPISNVSAASGVLVLEHTGGWVDPFGSGYDQTVTGLRTDEVFTDVVVRATILPQGPQTTLAGGMDNANNYVYLVARSSGASGYVLAFDWGERDFQLIRVDNGVIYIPEEQPVGPTPSLRIHGLDLNGTYVMELSIVGSNLTGRFYDETGTTLISEVVWTDNTYTSGWSGIGAFVNDLPGGAGTFISAAFDNVSSSVFIPEPASLALVGLGAMLVMGKRRR